MSKKLLTKGLPPLGLAPVFLDQVHLFGGPAFPIEND